MNCCVFGRICVCSRLTVVVVLAVLLAGSPAWSGVDDGLVSCWSMDEAANATRFDSVTTNHLLNFQTVGQAAGVVSNAADFDRSHVDEMLYAADSATLSTGNVDWTIAAWVNVNTEPVGTGYMALITKYDAEPNIEYFLWYDTTDVASGNRYKFTIYQGSAAIQYTVYPAASVAVGTGWHLVVAWQDQGSPNNSINIQIDNGAVATVNTGSNYSADTAAWLRVGNDVFVTNGMLDGQIDQVRFYHRVLTATEKTTLYNSGSGVSCEVDEWNLY